jgi:hypothetical protein
VIRRPADVAAAVALATVPLFGGCLAYKVVTTPVKLAATTVVVTGETAGAAVAATGKVAVSAFDAAGRMGSGGIDSASRLATSGMVTFMDVGTGTVVRVPWREGFTVASAGAEARVQLLSRAVDVVRSGAVIFSAKRLADGGAALAAGDVVRVRG